MKITRRPPRIFYNENNKKFYIKSKGVRMYLDISLLKGLSKDEIRRYLIQLVIKKRKYHMKIKKDKTKEITTSTSSNATSRMSQPFTNYVFSQRNEPQKIENVYKPPNALVPYVDKTSKPTSNDIVVRVKEEAKEEATEEAKEEAKEETEQEAKEETEQEAAQVEPEIIDLVNVEELPNEVQNPIYRGLDLINLRNLASRRSEIINEFGKVKTNFSSITKTGVSERVKFINDFLSVYPEQRENIRLIRPKDSKKDPPSQEKLREYFNSRPKIFKYSLVNGRALVGLLSQIMPINSIRDRNIRDFIVKSLSDKSFFEKEVEPNQDRVFNPYTGKIGEIGAGHFTDYKDGLYDFEIEKIMMDKTKQFVPVIMSDEIPSLLKYVTPKTKKFGFVMNTEDSSKQGMHWIGIFLDKENHEINYFDPLAENPPTDVFLRDIKLLVDKMKSPYMMKLKVNDVKFQSDDSSNCGFFCIKFLMDRYNMPFKDASGYTLDDSNDGEKRIERFKDYL